MSSSLPTPLTPFKVTRPQTQILPLTTRISKIQSLLGTENPAPLARIIEHKMELGGYDHANGVAVDLSWTGTRMSVWAKSLQPVCKSTEMNSRFPYPQSAAAFVTSALGRNLNSSDNELLAQVAAAPGDDSTRFNVLCTVVLSSLEFNSL